MLGERKDSKVVSNIKIVRWLGKIFLSTYQPIHLFICLSIHLAIFLFLSTCIYSAFKDIGYGARPSGMGGAFVALSNDTNAPLYNPAGIAQLEEIEATFMYHKPFAGFRNVSLNQGYVAFAYPFKKIGSFGVNFTNLSLTGFTRETTTSLTYANRVTKEASLINLYAGFNLRYLYHSVDLDVRTKALNDPVFAPGTSRDAFTFDVGFLLKYDLFGFGLAVKNINQPDVSFSRRNDDKVPFEIKTGLSCRIGDYKVFEDITQTLDITYRIPQGAKHDYNVLSGLESWFNYHTWAVRIGGNMREITTGASFNKAITSKLAIQVDYSFAYPIQLPDTFGSHRLSLSLRFSPPRRGAHKKIEIKKEEIKEEIEIEKVKEKEEKKAKKEKVKKEKIKEEKIKEEKIKKEEVKEEIEPITEPEKTPEQITELTEDDKVAKMKYWYAQGYNFYKRGWFENAIESFKKVLEIDPEHQQSKDVIAKAEKRIAQRNGLGRVDLNSATAEELRGLGFTALQSNNIIKYRQKRGGFKSTDELLKIRGIGRYLYNKVKDEIEVK